MKFPKSKRVRSKENLELVRQMACMVCGHGPVHVHHLVTRGSGGGDELENLAPLCPLHHGLIHGLGVKSFFERFALPVEWVNGKPRRLL